MCSQRLSLTYEDSLTKKQQMKLFIQHNFTSLNNTLRRKEINKIVVMRLWVICILLSVIFCISQIFYYDHTLISQCICTSNLTCIYLLVCLFVYLEAHNLQIIIARVNCVTMIYQSLNLCVHIVTLFSFPVPHCIHLHNTSVLETSPTQVKASFVQIVTNETSVGLNSIPFE